MLKKIVRIILVLGILTNLSLNFINAQEPRVKIIQLRNGDYQLLAEGKPYIIKGLCYSPIPIGENYEYNFWGDEKKPWMVDGQLMREMNANTVRFYQPGQDPNQTKQVIRDLYDLYNIRTIMTHYLGFWEYPSANYGDPAFRKRTLEDVVKMVKEYKDEPGILMWCLGNENNFSFGPQKVNPWTTPEIEALGDPYKKRLAKAKIYYMFVNEVANAIHKIDPDHPIMMGNGDLADVEIAKKYCRAVDVLGSTSYRGKSFGNFFRELQIKWGKPVIFSEFGCDAFDAYRQVEDQEIQAIFIQNQWSEIARNLPGNEKGYGNCLGGFIFEWNDEWWKAEESNKDSFKVHNTEGQWCHGSYYFDIKAPQNFNMNEEWWGVVALDPATDANGINKRVPRKIYYILQEEWGKIQ